MCVCIYIYIYITIVYPISSIGEEQPTNLFSWFWGFNLNQRKAKPGLEGPVGGLRLAFIKLEIIVLDQLADWKQTYSGMISDIVFEQYIKARDPVKIFF